MPPVANFKEVDPELGVLNLSKGGAYPVEYAMHLGAGFGSQISMILLQLAADQGRRSSQSQGAWLLLPYCRQGCLECLANPDGRPSGRGSGSGAPHVTSAGSRIGSADRRSRQGFRASNGTCAQASH